MTLLYSWRIRYSLYFAIAALVAGVVWLGWQVVRAPKQWVVPAQEIGQPDSLIRLRGAYLVNTVANCGFCHGASTDSADRAQLAGGSMSQFAETESGTFAINLTPAYLKIYSDEELYRGITQGIGRRGQVLSHAMPYAQYGTMDPQDVWAIIKYLRHLPARPFQHTAPEHDVFTTLWLKMRQQAPHPSNLEKLTTPVQQGNYLATIAGCLSCHSPQSRWSWTDMEKLGKGGRQFTLSEGNTVASTNISKWSDGLGTWTTDRFMARMRGDTTARLAGTSREKAFADWHPYKQMKEQDLKAILAYLQYQDLPK